jgi:hypothetical protein
MLLQVLTVANLGSAYPDDDQAVRWAGQTFGWDYCRRLGVHCYQQTSAVSEMPSRGSCRFEIVRKPGDQIHSLQYVRERSVFSIIESDYEGC